MVRRRRRSHEKEYPFSYTVAGDVPGNKTECMVKVSAFWVPLTCSILRIANGYVNHGIAGKLATGRVSYTCDSQHVKKAHNRQPEESGHFRPDRGDAAVRKIVARTARSTSTISPVVSAKISPISTAVISVRRRSGTQVRYKPARSTIRPALCLLPVPNLQRLVRGGWTHFAMVLVPRLDLCSRRRWTGWNLRNLV